MTLDEIRKMKDIGLLKPMRQDAKEHDLPDEFWKEADLNKGCEK